LTRVTTMQVIEGASDTEGKTHLAHSLGERARGQAELAASQRVVARNTKSFSENSLKVSTSGS